MAVRGTPVRELLGALLARDRLKADRVVEAALAADRQRVAVFSDLVQPVVSALDDLWYRGEVEVENERWAVATLAEIAGALPETLSPDPVPPGSHVVLAGLGTEQHAIGLGLVALALEDDGWDVALLGTGISPGSLLETVAVRRPEVVGLSASYLPDPRQLADMVSALRARRMNVLVGGQAFTRVNSLWRRVGADGYGVDARAGALMARSVLAASRPKTVLMPARAG